MFHQGNVNKTVYFFLVLLKCREIVTVKTVALYKKLYVFDLKSQKQEKEAGTNLIVLCHSRNMVGQFKKAYLHRPIKILHFLTSARIKKCLAYLQNILAFLTRNHLQVELRIWQGIFLHVFPVYIIVPCLYLSLRLQTT